MSDPYDKCTHVGLCPFDFNESEFRKKIKKEAKKSISKIKKDNRKSGQI
jgi:hypothetical protein